MARNATVDQSESDQLALHPFGLDPFHAVAVDELLALGELGDPAQSRFERRSSVVDIVAVEAESFFQPQRVAGTQSDVFQSVLLAGLPQRLPQPVGVGVVGVDLAAARAGVPRDREDSLAARDLGLFEGVVGHLLDGMIDQLLCDLHRQRPLYGQLADVVRSVFQFGARPHPEGFALAADVGPVLVGVGRIDTEHVFLVRELVDQNVVHDAAPSVGHAGVLHLARKEFGHVVGGDALQQIERLGALDPDFAHVAHVEDARALTHGEVFVVDAREFDGHVVSREFGHLRAGRDVILVKSGGFHSCYVFFCVYSLRLTPSRGQRWNSFSRSNR